MVRPSTVLAALGCLVLAGCVVPVGQGPQDLSRGVEIRWTSLGVPHIVARDWDGLGLGYGYASARDNLCVIAEDFVTAAGQRSQFFGPDKQAQAGYLGAFPLRNIESDAFFTFYHGDTAHWSPGATKLGPELSQMMDGFVDGYNRFLRTASDQQIGPCAGEPWLRPISVEDLHRRLTKLQLLASAYQLAPAMFAAQPPGTPAAPAPRGLPRMPEPGAGSNAYAFGSEATSDGRGLLLINPHFPWMGPERFHQLHLTIPGTIDVLGATVLGVPLTPIGITQDFAWTHTVSSAWRFTIYELTLVPGDPTSYMYDGVPRKMTPREVAITVTHPDGRTDVVRHRFYLTHFGPTIVIDLAGEVPGAQGLAWTTAKAYAFRDANAFNDRFPEQYVAMAKSKSLDEFTSAIHSFHGVPWVHTTAVSRDGRAFYGDVTIVPNLSADQVRDCNTPVGQFTAATTSPFRLYVLDGSRSACEWRVDPTAAQPGIVPSSRTPSTEVRTYVMNSNSNHWLPNSGLRLEGFAPLFGDERSDRGARSRAGYELIDARLQGRADCRIEPDVDCDKMTAARLQDLLQNHELLWPRLVMPDIQGETCAVRNVVLPGGQVVDIGPACQVLAAWDRRADLDSKGAILFRLFWDYLPEADRIWGTPFDPRDPVGTPRDLAGHAPRVRQELANAVLRMQAARLPLDVSVRDAQFVTRGNTTIPVHGAPGSLGTPNFLAFPFVPGRGLVELDERTSRSILGNSFMFTVTWDEAGPVVEGLLTYGQSTHPGSPHFDDQTRMYSAKQWPRVPFLPQDIRADPGLTVVKL